MFRHFNTVLYNINKTGFDTASERSGTRQCSGSNGYSTVLELGGRYLTLLNIRFISVVNLQYYGNFYLCSTYNMTDVNYRFLKIYFVCMVKGSSVSKSRFPHYYGTNTENSEFLVHSTFTYFYDSLVIFLRRPIKRRSVSLSPSSESLAPSSDSFVNPSICCYIALNSRHFVRHLGICYRICVKLIQLMCAVITHKSVKKMKSLY